MDNDFFNELSLREEIIRIWGPAGAHAEVFDMMLKELKMLREKAIGMSSQ